MSRVAESSDSRIPPGSDLLAINGHRIEDFLDFTFYNDINRPRKALVATNGLKKNFSFKPGEKMQIKLAEPSYRSCENRCRFCFVNGLPKGLRREVYFRDDDYRLSFLFGNFLSLTNVRHEDIERIGRLRLSPLYVSVHTTIPEARAKLFGNPRAGSIMRQIRQLAGKKIELHCQVVLIPGVTDGHSLDRTIADLSGFFPLVRSIGIVPVGGTKYTKGISRLTKKNAFDAVKAVERYRLESLQKTGSAFIFASDELFIRAELPVPSRSYYGDFPQYENGIGMVREFVDEVKSMKSPRKCRGRFLLLTGKMAFPFVRMLKQKLCEAGWRVDLARVRNSLFGRTVTVSGLLGAADMAGSAKRIAAKYDLVVLPPNCVNDEGSFIDNERPQIKNFLVAPHSVRELIKCLQ